MRMYWSQVAGPKTIQDYSSLAATSTMSTNPGMDEKKKKKYAFQLCNRNQLLMHCFMTRGMSSTANISIELGQQQHEP